MIINYDTGETMIGEEEYKDWMMVYISTFLSS